MRLSWSHGFLTVNIYFDPSLSTLPLFLSSSSGLNSMCISSVYSQPPVNALSLINKLPLNSVRWRWIPVATIVLTRFHKFLRLVFSPRESLAYLIFYHGLSLIAGKSTLGWLCGIHIYYLNLSDRQTIYWKKPFLLLLHLTLTYTFDRLHSVYFIQIQTFCLFVSMH